MKIKSTESLVSDEYDHDPASATASTAPVFVQLAFGITNVIKARHSAIGQVVLSLLCAGQA